MNQTFIICVVFWWSFYPSITAQDYHKISVESHKILDINVTDVWQIVQDWENLSTLAPETVKSTIMRGTGIDANWDIELHNGSIIKEKMVYFNDHQKTMSYIMTDTPMPVEDYRATILVESYGISKSRVSFFTSCKVEKENKPSIEENFKNFQNTYLSNLKNVRYE